MAAFGRGFIDIVLQVSTTILFISILMSGAYIRWPYIAYLYLFVICSIIRLGTWHDAI